MRHSVFNIYVPDFPEAGHTLVYNTLSGAFLEVEGDARAAEPEESWFDDDAGFVVREDGDDERDFQAWYQRIRTQTDVLSCIVSTTFACNFACTYCCQADVLDGHVMSKETAVKTAAWLASRAREIGATTLSLSFVGGEPLLQPDRIEIIVNALRAEGLPVRFSLITNGYFLTRELVEAWKPLGLWAAQVTLDGDEASHAVTRVSKKRGENTFQRIFDNVVAVKDLIALSINGNYQADTVEGFPRLIERLREAAMPSTTRLSFTPALNALGAPPESASGACTIANSNPQLMLALRDAVVAAGLTPAGDGLEFGPCDFHKAQSYAIDPDGHLYKCPGFLGKPEWAIGHVQDGLGPRYAEFVAFDVNATCSGCAQRPHCAGGCIAAEWIKSGRPAGVNCEGEYYEHHGATAIKRKYADAVAAAAGVSPFDLVPAMKLDEAMAPAGGRRSSSLRVVR